MDPSVFLKAQARFVRTCRIRLLLLSVALVAAMAFAAGKPGMEETTEFILSNISQRMAQGLREVYGISGRSFRLGGL